MNDETARTIIRQLPLVSDRVRRSLEPRSSGSAWIMVACAAVSAYMVTVVGSEGAKTFFSSLVPVMLLLAVGIASGKRSRSEARRGAATADAVALLSMINAGSKLHEHVVREAEIKRELSLVLFDAEMVMRVLQSEDRSRHVEASEHVRRSDPFFR